MSDLCWLRSYGMYQLRRYRHGPPHSGSAHKSSSEPSLLTGWIRFYAVMGVIPILNAWIPCNVEKMLRLTKGCICAQCNTVRLCLFAKKYVWDWTICLIDYFIS